MYDKVKKVKGDYYKWLTKVDRERSSLLSALARRITQYKMYLAIVNTGKKI